MKKSLLGLVALAALACGPAFAHHSFAMFDGNKLVVLKGTMMSFSYLNPHSWISLQGSPDGTGDASRWDVEATAPGALIRIGIQAQTLKPGDKITVGIRPLRDGRRGGTMVFVITPDGVSHGAKPSDLGLDLEKIKP